MAEMSERGVDLPESTQYRSKDALLVGVDSGWGTRSKVLFIISIVLIVVALCVLIAGIVLLNKETEPSQPQPQTDRNPTTTKNQTQEDGCQYSQEAVRSGYAKFLTKVRDNYYVHHPAKLPNKPDISEDEVRASFSMWDNKPEAIKKRTDASRALLKEIKNMKISVDKLKPREKKSLYQVKHYLQHVFGQPYEVNYYTGDWMLGPNLFCWQPVCHLSYDVKNLLQYFQPKEFSDIAKIKSHLEDFQKALLQYESNMRLGIKTGMIRSREECVAGYTSFSRSYMEVFLNGPQAVLNESYTSPIKDDEYWKDLKSKSSEWNSWVTKYGKDPRKTVEGYLVEYVGKPLDDLIKYLKVEHMSHCVPSNVSSGLGSLPVDYVYTNGTADKSQPTTKKLPSGETLNGANSYDMIMSYFTTNKMTADEVHDLGWKMLGQLYPQVLEVARAVTGEKTNNTAKTAFIKRLSEADMFFGRNFPENESNEEAFIKCISIETAKMHCPVRWAAMERWFKFARDAMSMFDPKTLDFFHFSGDYHTTPNCPVEMNPNFNPSSGAQSYYRSTPDCSRTAKYNIPFFLAEGSVYEEWSVNAHEARPGHHTQVQGLVEHFRDPCGGDIRWIDDETYYTAFTEGWALYAENPLIAQDTDTYEDPRTFLQKYGMLKWQVWRALRLIVDTGLHSKGYNRDWALKMFEDYAWDKSDGAEKEVTRYQSDPGQATAYMIGQQHLIKLRTLAKQELKDKFNMRDFHYQILSQGSAPLQYLQEHIEKYIACVKDKSGDGCATILGPPKKTQPKTTTLSKSVWRPERVYMR